MPGVGPGEDPGGGEAAFVGIVRALAADAREQGVEILARAGQGARLGPLGLGSRRQLERGRVERASFEHGVEPGHGCGGVESIPALGLLAQLVERGGGRDSELLNLVGAGLGDCEGEAEQLLALGRERGSELARVEAGAQILALAQGSELAEQAVAAQAADARIERKPAQDGEPAAAQAEPDLRGRKAALEEVRDDAGLERLAAGFDRAEDRVEQLGLAGLLGRRGFEHEVEGRGGLLGRRVAAEPAQPLDQARADDREDSRVVAARLRVRPRLEQLDRRLGAEAFEPKPARGVLDLGGPA